jgi:hypothetical protein
MVKSAKITNAQPAQEIEIVHPVNCVWQARVKKATAAQPAIAKMAGSV